MRKLLIACLNLLLVFNNIGFQAINATEVDPPNEETYEPSLPTEETNSDDSINEETVLEINDSVEDEQISTLATNTVEFLDKEKFRNSLPEGLTNLYFGTKSDYDLSKCTKTIDLGNNYTLYTSNENISSAFTICNDGMEIIFPKDSSSLFEFKSNLKNITFKHIDTSYVKNMSGMFRDCNDLTTLDLSNFNTENVTNMEQMFNECQNLTSLDVSNFNTENVTNMIGMFCGCNNIAILNLSNFNTENVTSMDWMFIGCKSLTSLDVSNFNTSNVTGMYEMFYHCQSLTSLDVSNFNTGNVTSMDGMFNDCKNLHTIYASNLFNTSKSNSKDMFNQCTNLIGGLGTKFDSSKTNYEYAHIDGGTDNPGYFSEKHPSKPTLSVEGAYTYTGVEQTVTVTGYDSNTMDIEGNKATKVGTYTVTVTPKTQWSDGTKEAVTVTWSIIKADPSYTLPTGLIATQGDKLSDVTLPEGWKWKAPETQLTDAGSYIYTATFTPEDTKNYNVLADIAVTVEIIPHTIEFLDKEKFRNNLSFDVTNLYFGTESDYDLSKCTQTINIGNNYTLYTYEDNSTYDAYVICQDGKQIFFPEDSSSLFGSKSSLKNITFKHIDTSHVKNMSEMFDSCHYLSTLDLSNFNTENVTGMDGMFNDCRNLSLIDLSSFNTENVTNMSAMFSYCGNLSSIDLSSFNTCNVTDMNMMFAGCENLSSIDLSSFNTENVTNMSYMFATCGNLSSIDLSSFNTCNVTNMYGMFMASDKLSFIDLSNFNTENVTSMDGMFNYCKNLHTIYASNLFNTSKSNSKDMFTQCTNLIGGLGTKFDSSKTNYEYARIDGGTSNPGYFSCKHTWDSGVVTTEPTCVNKGIKTFKCTKCDATKTEDIAALGHNYTAETIKPEALKTPGTCTDKAIYYKSCERCGQVDTDENNTFEGEVDSTNHNYSDWKITKNPTCTETGSKEKTCSRCNNKIIEELSALGHEYSTEWTIDVEPTCTNAGSKSHHCTRKNCTSKSDVTEISMTEHTWDSGVVTTEPTCVNKGIKTFKCTKCDATKTEDIAALGHELTHVTKKDATTEDFGNIEYWNCSKCKKNFNDSKGTNEITGSTVIPKLAPSIIKGDNQTVTEKEEKALSVTSNASYDDFIEVKVDGTTLDISKYTKAKGSTIITLNADYVSTLSVGTHTLDVVSKFGTATAHFKVEKKVEITPTPETNKSSTTDKTSNGWDDGGPFTTDKCGNVFDRWNNKIYEANGCNVGGYNLVSTSVID